MRKKYTFKEITQDNDLEKCFKFRYQFFSDDTRKVFLLKQDAKIDIDIFDFYSKHWGVVNDKNEIIGYARIIDDNLNTEVNDAIKSIAKKYNIAVKAKKKYRYPIQLYQSDISKIAVDEFLKEKSKNKIIELSRFFIKNDAPRAISKFMVLSGLGIYKNIFGIDFVVLGCSPKYENFWKLISFKKLNRDSTYMVENTASINLFSDFKNIYPKFNAEMLKMSLEFKIKNQVTLEI